jgi:hypothetical protein
VFPNFAQGDSNLVITHAAKADAIALGSARFYQVYYRDQAVVGSCVLPPVGPPAQNISQGQWCFWGP